MAMQLERGRDRLSKKELAAIRDLEEAMKARDLKRETPSIEDEEREATRRAQDAESEHRCP